MYTRDYMIGMVKEKVQSIKKVTAAWQGGSAATGYIDEYSDLDLCLVTKDHDTEEVLNEVVDFLTESFQLKNMYRLPEPTPHGFSQVFFNPVVGPDLFYVDFVVMGESTEDKYIEENRHGQAEIWVDKYKLDGKARSEEDIYKLAKTLYETTIEKDFLLITELKKQLKRKIYTEVFPIYSAFISRCIVQMMNIKYRPEKADFGMRYIYRDYPNEAYKYIESVLKANSVDEIGKYLDILLIKYEELKEDLKVTYFTE